MPKASKFVSSTMVPGVLTLALAVVYLLLRILQPAWASLAVQSYFQGAFVAAAGVLAVRILGYLAFDIYFLRRKGRQAPQLLRLVMAVVGYAALFVLIYTLVLDRSLSGFLATSAVLSIVLGLALQDTLGNFFAGISLHIEQPFQIGDCLRLGAFIGRVESVTWRTTAIRTNDNSLIVFPNSQVAKEPIEVFRLRELNRRILRFPAPYAAPPRKVIPLVQEAVRSIAGVAPEKTPVVRIGEFADSCVTYELLYWIRDYMDFSDMDCRIRERIWYVFIRNGISIPFPVRHLLMEHLEAPARPQQTDRLLVLEKVEVLGPLDRPAVEAIAGAAVARLFGPNELVLRQGDDGDSMFVILRGRAEVRLSLPGRDSRRVTVLEAGDYFGEMGLFTGERRSADVVAIEELELLEIHKNSLEPLLHENPELAHRFSLVVAKRQQRLAQLSQGSADEAARIQPETVLGRIRRFFRLS